MKIEKPDVTEKKLYACWKFMLRTILLVILVAELFGVCKIVIYACPALFKILTAAVMEFWPVGIFVVYRIKKDYDIVLVQRLFERIEQGDKAAIRLKKALFYVLGGLMITIFFLVAALGFLEIES